jgi:hypothetical protein
MLHRKITSVYCKNNMEHISCGLRIVLVFVTDAQCVLCESDLIFKYYLSKCKGYSICFQ